MSLKSYLRAQMLLPLVFSKSKILSLTEWKQKIYLFQLNTDSLQRAIPKKIPQSTGRNTEGGAAGGTKE